MSISSRFQRLPLNSSQYSIMRYIERRKRWDSSQFKTLVCEFRSLNLSTVGSHPRPQNGTHIELYTFSSASTNSESTWRRIFSFAVIKLPVPCSSGQLVARMMGSIAAPALSFGYGYRKSRKAWGSAGPTILYATAYVMDWVKTKISGSTQANSHLPWGAH